VTAGAATASRRVRALLMPSPPVVFAESGGAEP
jgi:hypothetical protein